MPKLGYPPIKKFKKPNIFSLYNPRGIVMELPKLSWLMSRAQLVRVTSCVQLMAILYRVHLMTYTYFMHQIRRFTRRIDLRRRPFELHVGSRMVSVVLKLLPSMK